MRPIADHFNEILKHISEIFIQDIAAECRQQNDSHFVQATMR